MLLVVKLPELEQFTGAGFKLDGEAHFVTVITTGNIVPAALDRSGRFAVADAADERLRPLWVPTFPKPGLQLRVDHACHQIGLLSRLRVTILLLSS